MITMFNFRGYKTHKTTNKRIMIHKMKTRFKLFEDPSFILGKSSLYSD